ncbi:MAG: hypothetical protein ACKVY0_13855 [Prosthecobacter sp.]|uniref:hypothetical protein n=1 Tax=Prosthecobacter sp. TaxID=1965333 RepID=UPI003902AD8D
MRILSLLFLSVIHAPLAQAENRVFVSLAGSLLEAEITAISGDSVTLKRASDGQVLAVKRSTLCKEDHAFIAAWAAENLNPSAAPAPTAAATPAPAQKYSLACQVLPVKSNRGPSDGFTRTFETSYACHISNREVKRDLQGAKGIVITLAKHAAEASGDLIVLQKQEFDISIRSQAKMVYTTEPVQLTYYQGTPRSGVRSHGLVLFILDAAGNILLSESSPDGNTKFAKEIMALTEVPCVVDRDFKLQTKAEVPTGYIQF